MPPELPHYRSVASPPVVNFLPPSSPETHLLGRKTLKGNHIHGMKIPGRKIIPLLLFVLSTISVLRLLRIATFTSSSRPPSAKFHPSLQNKTYVQRKPTTLTKKEFKLLSDLIKHKSPCKLLVFGMERQYLKLSSINSGGINVFLEDDADRISNIRVKSNNTTIYKVDYRVPVKEAYELLRHARKNPSCSPSPSRLEKSTCRLALTDLPEEVYRRKWDVVVVDGPSGHSLEAPGRMAAIYTAAVMARTGNATDVLVHDVDRTIEKWFSREFLCEENLVSSKGKFWNFRIANIPNSTQFCTD